MTRTTKTAAQLTAEANEEDRRAALRLAGGGHVEAVLVDQYDNPVEVVRGVQVLNVSANGVALIARTKLQPGSILSVTAVGSHGEKNEDRHFKLETLDCKRFDEKLQKIRCKLVAGRVPAELIYNW